MSRPAPGDRILVFKDRWLSLVLSGKKTLEIRGCALKPGRYYLGCKQKIYGIAELGAPLRVSSQSQWLAMKDKHLVDTAGLPYKRTFALPILKFKSLPPCPYQHKRGAIGIVIYR